MGGKSSRCLAIRGIVNLLGALLLIEEDSPQIFADKLPPSPVAFGSTASFSGTSASGVPSTPFTFLERLNSVCEDTQDRP
jgi:hypothetical protein